MDGGFLPLAIRVGVQKVENGLSSERDSSTDPDGHVSSGKTRPVRLLSLFLSHDGKWEALPKICRPFEKGIGQMSKDAGQTSHG